MPKYSITDRILPSPSRTLAIGRVADVYLCETPDKYENKIWIGSDIYTYNIVYSRCINIPKWNNYYTDIRTGELKFNDE